MDYLDNLLVGENKKKTAAIIGVSLAVNIVSWVSSAFIVYGIYWGSGMKL